MFLVPLPSGLYNKHKLQVTFLVGSQFVRPGPFRLGAILLPSGCGLASASHARQVLSRGSLVAL